MSNGATGSGPTQPATQPQPAPPAPTQPTQPTPTTSQPARHRRGAWKYILGLLGASVIGVAVRPYGDAFIDEQFGTGGYSGSLHKNEATNAKTIFGIDDGRVSIGLKGTQESGDFEVASREIAANTRFRIDTRGKISIDAKDPCDPNALHYIFKGDRTGGYATWNSTDAGKYKATVTNGPMDELKSLDGYKD